MIFHCKDMNEIYLKNTRFITDYQRYLFHYP